MIPAILKVNDGQEQTICRKNHIYLWIVQINQICANLIEKDIKS